MLDGEKATLDGEGSPMYETNVCMVGRVGSDIRFVRTDNGTPFASFRLVSTTRRFDRGEGGWVDGNTKWVSVLCRRGLAEHVASSVGKGEPVVVYGELRSRSWEREGRSGNEIEVFAHTVGHDLNYGVSAYRKVSRDQQGTRSDDQVADQLVRDLHAEGEPKPDGDQKDGSSTGAKPTSVDPTVAASSALPSRNGADRPRPRQAASTTQPAAGVGGQVA